MKFFRLSAPWIRTIVYVGLFVLASRIAVPTVHATESIPVHFDQALLTWGTTLKTTDQAQIGVFPHAFDGPADVTWTLSDEAVPTLPDNQTLVGPLYRLTISGMAAYSTAVKLPVAIALPATPGEFLRRIWQYDRTTKVWTVMKTGWRSGRMMLQAQPKSLDAFYVVLDDHRVQEGQATWYCKRACSQRYPKLHGTSNDFAVGSMVMVTNLDNGKSVNVKIVSGWGKPAGRVIDLSWPAFSALHSSNAGVARVRVTSITSTVSAPPTPVPVAPPTAEPAAAESLPTLKVQDNGQSVAPVVSAKSFVVIDQATGTVLAEKNENLVTPIASLTKLMTAMVFLDTNPSLDTVVTYTKADVTPYAYLQVKPGEQLRLRDVFNSMLVGSANNAATLLARSTGLTRADFIQRMNDKAASWGLTNTHFVEVSGLDAGNVSNAKEYAVLAGHAFHDYQNIRSATSLLSYSFTTTNTKVSHTIKTTDKLHSAGMTGLQYSGSKTGFIDESLYTYVLRTTNEAGAKVITVVFGDPTSAARFQDAKTLSLWAWSAHQWLNA